MGGVRPLKLFARYQRSEKALVSALAEMYVQGVWTVSGRRIDRRWGYREVNPWPGTAATASSSRAKWRKSISAARALTDWLRWLYDRRPDVSPNLIRV